MKTVRSFVFVAAIALITNIGFGQDGLPDKIEEDSEQPYGVISLQVGAQKHLYGLSEAHSKLHQEAVKLAQDIELGKAKLDSDEAKATEHKLRVLAGLEPAEEGGKAVRAEGVKLLEVSIDTNSAIAQESGKSTKSCWRGGWGWGGWGGWGCGFGSWGWGGCGWGVGIAVVNVGWGWGGWGWGGCGWGGGCW